MQLQCRVKCRECGHSFAGSRERLPEQQQQQQLRQVLPPSSYPSTAVHCGLCNLCKCYLLLPQQCSASATPFLLPPVHCGQLACATYASAWKVVLPTSSLRVCRSTQSFASCVWSQPKCPKNNFLKRKQDNFLHHLIIQSNELCVYQFQVCQQQRT